MSAIFAAVGFNASDSADVECLRGAFSSLQFYGGDHTEFEEFDDACVGCHLRWVTPEDRGSSQPISFKGGRKKLVFDGRIDNRDVICSELGVRDTDELNDARLISLWLDTFGVERLSAIVGPFALIMLDTHTSEATLARDAMGGRGLVFTRWRGGWVCATDESAFLELLGFNGALNRAKVARHLNFSMDAQPESFSFHATQVRPGEYITLGNGPPVSRRFYQPTICSDVRGASLEENAKRFKQLLNQAVKRRLRGANNVGMMLSGGLDSTPIFSLACNAQSNQQFSLRAYSWVFPNYPEVDEIRYSKPLCNQHEIEQIRIDCEEIDIAPNNDLLDDPRVPFTLPFVAFQLKTLELAQLRHENVMLSGMHGDLLYSGAGDVVIEALRAGDVRLALAEFRQLAKRIGSNWRAFKRYVLTQTRFVQRVVEFFQSKRAPNSDMLSDELQFAIQFERHWLADESVHYPRPSQFRKVFDAFAGEDICMAKRTEAPYGIERRYPFRDRDVCEFILSVPSAQLYSLGQVRPIIKRAFRDDLPSAILDREDKAVFITPLVDQLRSMRSSLEKSAHADTSWQHFVKKTYVHPENMPSPHQLLALWRCAYYTLWRIRNRDSNHTVNKGERLF